MGFALTLQPLIEKIKTEVPSLSLNAWYLDDGTLIGSVDDLRKAVDIIESIGPARGLFTRNLHYFFLQPLLSQTIPFPQTSLSLARASPSWGPPLDLTPTLSQWSQNV